MSGMSGAGDRGARLALARLVEPGSWAVHTAVEEHGAEAVVAALLAGRAVPPITTAVAQGARLRGQGVDPAADLRTLALAKGRLVVPGDEEWPEHLLTWPVTPGLPAPPLALHVRGTLDLGATVEQAVAVVGARAASAYGEHVATELGLGLADRGWTVVSGGAYGIDAAAHRGALTSGLAATVAVLACGLDVAYPRGNDRLLARIAETGLLVSEHPPGVTPTRPRFLVRNRLIAALSAGTVVVEAALRSGSLSTAGRAKDLNRHVMAVPGPVTSAASAGSHALLRQQETTLVAGVDHVLALVGRLSDDDAPDERGPERPRDRLEQVVQQVLEQVPVRGGAGEAVLARAGGVPVSVVQRVLPELYVAGLITRSPTGWRLTALGAQRPADPPVAQESAS